MIEFKSMDLLKRIWRRISPAYRKRQDEALMQSIRYLVENPSAACVVAGSLIQGEPLARLAHHQAGADFLGVNLATPGIPDDQA